MGNLAPQVGKVVRSTLNIQLNQANLHVTVLSSAAPPVLPKGTEAEITAVSPSHIEVNCKDGFGNGPNAWGLKLRVARYYWGQAFE